MEILRLLGEGASVREVAARSGRPVSTVYRLRREAGKVRRLVVDDGEVYVVAWNGQR